MSNLASILAAQGDLAQARTLEEQVVQASRGRFGGIIRLPWKRCRTWPRPLVDQGDLSARARPLQEQVLEGMRRRLGADHPSPLTAMSNLAETLRAQGDLAQARPLQEQVLASRRRQLGASPSGYPGSDEQPRHDPRRQGDLVKAREARRAGTEGIAPAVGRGSPEHVDGHGQPGPGVPHPGRIGEDAPPGGTGPGSAPALPGPGIPDTSLAE